MKKIDWVSYVKLFLGMSLIFPFEWTYWSLDFGKISGLYIALTIHLSLFVLGVITFNYLETGNCFTLAKKYDGTLLERPRTK